MSGPRLRHDLARLPAYTPGRAARPNAEGARTLAQGHKLSSNENPYPPLPSVLDAVADTAAVVNRYPDMTAAALTTALADTLHVPPDDLAVGAGSVGVLGHVLAAAVTAGDDVVYAWRSFEAYPILVQVAGGTPVPVPLNRREEHDLDAMAAAITDRTRLILICSPNNPTGTAHRRDELERFLDRVPADVLVIIDEAYHEFVTDPDVPDGLDLYRDRTNVAVLRTFSKAYGLAGLRVGYLMAHADVAAAVRRTTPPFAVTAIAQAAAIASLDAGDEMRDRVERLNRERCRVEAALIEQGWDLVPSQANFVWLRTGPQTASMAAACADAGVAVRPYANEGVRVTIGAPHSNDAFLSATAAWRA